MQNPEATTIMPPDTTLVTRSGVTIMVRGVKPTDSPVLEALFEHVSPADLRFRFLSGLRHIDAARIQQMIEVDHPRSMTFIAFANDCPVATAMLATEPDSVTADVAISVRSDMKARGIGWTLLQHVLRFAEANGIERVSSMESRGNIETLALERDAGFEIRSCDGDPADVIASKRVARP